MLRRSSSILGAVMAIAGLVFTLQGVGIIGGSFMSGRATWALLGPLIAAAGVVLYAFATRRG